MDQLDSARAEAKLLDQEDKLGHLRDEFLIPSQKQIASESLAPVEGAEEAAKKSIYLCGNSLGLQPKRAGTRLQQYLSTWAAQGVQGHFKPLRDSPLPTWLDADAQAARMMAPIVGAETSEVAVMQTLTANLHLLLSAFYKPDANGRHKIILESKAFPSDHFAVESQIRHHGLQTETSMVTIDAPFGDGSTAVTTYDVMSVISKHAATTAVLLLPGIQFYTGELFDISAITSFAHHHGIFVIWDLAHAVGNVPLRLHDWDVDAAVWCTYKYLNSGPGGIGGLFVHERNGQVTRSATDEQAASGYTNRLAGWWGNDKSTRFVMTNQFHPVAGAAGFQLSNPSILDVTALCASLEVFGEAGGMGPLREKSLRLTAFLESLLEGLPEAVGARFRVLTPSDPGQRGAQLSLLLVEDEDEGAETEGGILEKVMASLEAQSVIVDDRKPNVIRVAPAPLYNTFEDCVDFVAAFGQALSGAE